MASRAFSGALATQRIIRPDFAGARNPIKPQAIVPQVRPVKPQCTFRKVLFTFCIAPCRGQSGQKKGQHWKQRANNG